MKRITATAIGLVLAAGLALAAPKSEPMDLAQRYFAANDEAGLANSWQDWHPEAEHSITIKYGMGEPDDQFNYKTADWETTPDWGDDPEYAETMRGYTETFRKDPSFRTEETDEGTVITATTWVSYLWQRYRGQMKQTDRFLIVSHLGTPVIRSLTTTIDYR
ncbi:hypothetical protein [Aliiroseovarius sp. S253]|uniref:hypothetical protein n=1 Tax=Aliiroseovarius sp. S253 TaxID=3415133 RepID=UPI003C7BD1E2